MSRVLWSLSLLVGTAGAAGAAATSLSSSLSSSSSTSSSLPTPTQVLNTLQGVMNFFMTNSTPGDCHWERATYFFGHSEAVLVTNSTQALDFMVAWADGNSYECDDSVQPNDFGSGWGYSTLYQYSPQDYKLAMGVTMNRAVAEGALPPCSFWWADTLSMNIPQWILYSIYLGNEPNLFNLAWSQYNNTKYGTPAAPTQPTCESLFDEKYNLWYRDHTFKNATSPNGKPVFWGRGQAWVGATLVKTLSIPATPFFPAYHPLRLDLQSTLVSMASALASTQNTSTGFWSASILDAEAFPSPETTSTAGITAMLAYGVRTGLLSAAEYAPIIAASWAGLTTIALSSPTLGPNVPVYCQPVGDQPVDATIDDYSDFCTGLYLLAGAEVYRLVVSNHDDESESVHIPTSTTSTSSSPSSSPPFDLTNFETTIVPKWVAQFAVPSAGQGAFAYTNGGTDPCVYGSAGVIHALSVLQQLNLSIAETQAWGERIDSFQIPTSGLYTLQPVESSAGYQPWHAAGWAGAALRILGRRTEYPPAFAQQIALGGFPLWNASLIEMFTDPRGIWSSSHKIASIPGVLMMNDPSHYNTTYAPFFTWFWDFLQQTSSPTCGYWCLPPNIPPPTSIDCLGGAFHISFTLACGKQLIPNAEAMLNVTLAAQNPVTGLWNNDASPGYMDQDGIYIGCRTSVQLGKYRWEDVKTMCTRYISTASAVLNNETEILGAKSTYGGIVHLLAGVVTSIAECAHWFPELVVIVRPWVNTVDVGCFG